MGYVSHTDEPARSSSHHVSAWHRVYRLCVLSICLLAGCANGMSPFGLSSMMPGNNISGQFEPDVDYEAETAARERQGKSDRN